MFDLFLLLQIQMSFRFLSCELLHFGILAWTILISCSISFPGVLLYLIHQVQRFLDNWHNSNTEFL